MLSRLFGRSSPRRAESPTRTVIPPLSNEHQRQTDAVLGSLVRHGVLFDDEYALVDVYDHVCRNGPENPDDPIEFDEVIGSIVRTPDPLTNLVFIPIWSELGETDVEEFTESICWLAGINTSAAATAAGGDGSDPACLTVRFELEPGPSAAFGVVLVPKGVPEQLIERLAELIDPRIAPRQLAMAVSGGHGAISALDLDTMQLINDETNAGYVPVRPPNGLA